MEDLTKTENKARTYEEFINGNLCQVMIDFNGQKTIRPIGDLVDTNYYEFKEKFDSANNQESSKQKFPNLTQKASEDPVATIVLSFLVFILMMIISFITLKTFTRQPMPYKVVDCKPTFFLFFKTGETCNTEEGFR